MQAGTSPTRVVRVGGVGKRELRSRLESRGIKINAVGEALFAHDGFVTSEVSSLLETAEVTVASLGHAHGNTLAPIYESARAIGLCLCPLELGPHLRLQLLDPSEGRWVSPPSQRGAPPGSLTIASQPLTEDEDVPKGFYLHCIEGTLWLRGYRCGREHVWSPEDRFIFCRPPSPVCPVAPSDAPSEPLRAPTAVESGPPASDC